MIRLALHWQIFIAMLLAGLLGYVATENTQILSINLLSILSFVGTLFLNALKMVVLPLIVASIISSIANIEDNSQLKRLGWKTISLYLASSLLAILIGLFWVNTINPGIINGQAAGEQLNLAPAAQLDITLEKIGDRNSSDIADIFIRMIPTNIVKAGAEGAILGLIVFSFLFAFFMRQAQENNRKILQQFWQGVYETMLAMTLWIIRLAPIGVFALIAKTVITTGFSALKPMLVFFICVSLALVTHAMLTLPALLVSLGRINPFKHYRFMLPALLTAFSTASSSATLPLTMESVRATGVSEQTNSFVLPLGATINMDGTALYECVAAMFIAQAYGLELSVTTQFIIVLIALLTSIGVAGIPAASLVAITLILTAIGLPIEAIGLLLITDRLLDMMRTAINILSDSCCAAIIASSEKETLLTHL